MEDLQAAIGARMQKLRLLNHLTQEKLAEQLDVSVKHISSVECGNSSLSLDKLIHVCAILDCSMDYLVLGKQAADTECFIPDSILDIFHRSDSEEIALLQEYLQFFKKLRPNT